MVLERLSVLIVILLGPLQNKILCVDLIGCNRYTGPAGVTKCIKAANYDHYQWGTCLTDTYIRTKSARKHKCQNIFATYCWYQCALELFGAESGYVNPRCRCSPTDDPDKTSSVLPAWCYSPTGKDCTWYKQCLEKRYPCEKTTADYAVTYATHYCEAYNKNYKQFSLKGRQWIDAVRKCLQVSLVPILRNSYSDATCETIKEKAFKSHDCCYLAKPECTPFGTPSICDIPASDVLYVFDTIGDAMVSEFSASFSSGLAIFLDCPSIALNVGKLVNLKLTLELKNKAEHVRDVISLMLGKLSWSIIDALSKQLNWAKNKLYWFAYPIITTNLQQKYEQQPQPIPDQTQQQQQQQQPNENGNSGYFDIKIVLFDKVLIDDGNANPSDFLNNTMVELVETLQTGNLIIKTTSNIEATVAFGSKCEDVRCEKSTKFDTSVSLVTVSSARRFGSNLHLLLFSFLVISRFW